VAALAGHATAGGTILALTADYRFGTPGRKLIGLNEVNIGVPVPYLADLILRHILSERHATRIVYRGDLVEQTAAKDLGLVDEIHPEAELAAAALAAVKELAERPQPAFGIIKNNRVHAVQSAFEKQRQAKKIEMLDCWFLPPVQAMLKKAAEKF
jgi:enoyl-CoA hydratase/carnithine racemase